MATTLVRIQQRRKTAAAWTSSAEVLLPGELGIETDTLKVKIGDGVTAWAALAYHGASGTDPGALQKTANLSDLQSPATARTNLGLKSGATTNIVQSATAPADTTAVWIDIS